MEIHINLNQERTLKDMWTGLNLSPCLPSSFHGLAFSLLFGKQFYAAFKKNSGRAESLLAQLCIPGRLLQPMGLIPEADSEIDYVAVYERMKELRNFSLQYLKDL